LTEPRKTESVSRRTVLASLPLGALAGGAAGGLFGSTPDAPTEPAPPPASPDMASGATRKLLDAGAAGAVGDGMFDNTSILNSLLASASGRTGVYLPPGDYVVADSLRLPESTTLVGAGSAATKISLADSTDRPFVLLSQADNISISGILFDGGDQDSSAVSLQIDGCHDVLVERCAFTRMKHAVHVYSSQSRKASRVTVRESVFSNIIDFAIRVSEGAEHVLIAENTIEDVAKAEAPSPSAIYVRGAHTTVSTNVVLSSEDTGVLVAGEDARHFLVKDNSLHTRQVGVFVGSGATGGIVADNFIESERDFGVHLFDRDGRAVHCTVRGNIIENCGKSGIQIEGVSDFSLIGNTITDPGRRLDEKREWRCGVAIGATAGGPASRFVITNNRITSTPGSDAMAHAVYLASANGHVEIASNVLRGAIGDAVMLDVEVDDPYYIDTIEAIVTSRRFAQQVT